MSNETVEDIPSNKNIPMTVAFDRIFRAVGCVPTCHCCDTQINENDLFKLAVVSDTPRDVRSYPKERRALLKGEKKSVRIYQNDVTLHEHEVMLCGTCTSNLYMQRQIADAEKQAKDQSRPGYRGGCFRVNGKLVTEL